MTSLQSAFDRADDDEKLDTVRGQIVREKWLTLSTLPELSVDDRAIGEQHTILALCSLIASYNAYVPWAQEAKRVVEDAAAQCKTLSDAIQQLKRIAPGIDIEDFTTDIDTSEDGFVWILISNVVQATKPLLTNHFHPLAAALRTGIAAPIRDQFAWALVQQWLAGDGPGRGLWALAAAGIWGQDVCALGLAPFIRESRKRLRHDRAGLGLECLRAIGTDVAMLQIGELAAEPKLQGIAERAGVILDIAAGRIGSTRKDMLDAIASTLATSNS